MSRDTPLHRALDKSVLDFKEIKNCLDQDSSCVHEVDCCGRTPLMLLLRNENCTADIVKLLLHYQEDLTDGNVLTTALRHSRDEAIIVALLEKKGANLNECDQVDRSHICHALRNGYPKGVIKMLLDAGCSPKCRFHDTILHCAVNSRSSGLKRKQDILERKQDIFNLLLHETTADVNSVDEDRKQSLLCYALNCGAGTHEIEWLLNAGSSFNDCKRHKTLWHCATSMYVRLDMVNFIRESGSAGCIETVDKVGNTPLQRALQYSKYETGAIKLLLDLQKFNVNEVRNERNDTLLHSAVANINCKLSALELLIDRGFQVDQVDANGQIPLHVALSDRCCRKSIIAMLLKNGSPVNVWDNFGGTPLKSAVIRRDTNTLRMLLVAGAQIRVAEGFRGTLLLRRLLSKYDLRSRTPYQQDVNEMLACFKLLIKYSFIEYPNFEIESLIQGREDYATFLDFAGKCVCELREMESMDIGHSRTLYEFVSACPLSQVDADIIKAEDCDFNQLLRIRADNVFPIYFDIIAAKVGRLLMKTKLEEMLVYTVKNRDESACLEKKVVLNYESVCKISQFLSDEDFLKLIAAFYNSNDHTASGFVSKEKIHVVKRSPEQSTEMHKRTKFHH